MISRYCCRTFSCPLVVTAAFPPSASSGATNARWSLGVLIYTWYAALDHLPNILIVASPSPRAAAVVAAPLRKLCPVYPSAEMPLLLNAFWVSWTKRGLVSGFPSWRQNNGPSVLPLFPKYASIAPTGHSLLPVRPTYTSTPLLNGSVFEVFSRTLSDRGFSLLSTARSLKLK